MTRVDFSFAIGDAQYRVERLPETDGSKERGTGMREQNASPTVYEKKRWWRGRLLLPLLPLFAILFSKL